MRKAVVSSRTSKTVVRAKVSKVETASTILPLLGFDKEVKQLPPNTPITAELYEQLYSGVSNIFDHPMFNGYKEEEAEYIANMGKSIKVIESIYVCIKCGYKRISVVQKQLRSGDESASTICRCMKCSHSWSTSG